jgi:hypothetical protein
MAMKYKPTRKQCRNRTSWLIRHVDQEWAVDNLEYSTQKAQHKQETLMDT